MKFLEYQDLAQFNCLLDGLDSGDSIVYGKIEVYSCKKTTQDKKLSKELAQRFTDTTATATATAAGELSPASPAGAASTSPPPSSLTSQAAPRTIPLQKNQFLSQRYGNNATQQQPGESRLAGSFEEHISSYTTTAAAAAAMTTTTANQSPRNNNNSNNVSTSASDSPFGPLSNSSSRNIFADLIATLNASYPDYDFRYAKPEDFTREHSMEHVYNSINLSLQDTLSLQNRNNLWSSIDSIIDTRNCEIYSYHPDEDDDDDDDPLALGNGKIWSWNYFFYNRKHKKILYFACNAKTKMSIRAHMSAGSQFGSHAASFGGALSASGGAGGMGIALNSSSMSGNMCDSAADTDSDYDSYYSNPKNQYVHAYPRSTTDDESYDGYHYGAMRTGGDDDDEDGMDFDDI